ncbi:MAG TPA: hypothetical protein PKD00_09320 [Burkholderiales bacterium]|nr:hypothetical protein [Burkholderiales bacterium]
MSKTVIPDLKNKLKQMLIDFVEKYKYHEFLDSASQKHYYAHRHEKYEKDNDIFFDKVLNKVIYEMEYSEIIRNLVRIDEIKSCSSCNFSFIGLEQNEEIPILISAPFYDETEKNLNKLRFDISPYYIDELKNQATPKVFYKDSRYYKNKKSISVTIYNEIAVYWERKQFVLKDDLSTDVISAIIKFLNLKDLYIMNLETKNIDINNFFNKNNEDDILLSLNSGELECDLTGEPTIKDLAKLKCIQDNMAKGIRLYKIPNDQFNWQPYLEKISEKLKSLQNITGKIYSLDDYMLYMKQNISFEYSPDNYLEIYGTNEALQYFLLGSEEYLSGFKMCYGDEYKFLYMLDHYEGSSGFDSVFMSIFCHHFGSQENKITNHLAFYSIN